MSVPRTQTGFETKIVIGGVDIADLVRAEALHANGSTLGWTGALDGNGNVVAGDDPSSDEVKVNTQKASRTQSVMPSRTASSSSGKSSAIAASGLAATTQVPMMLPAMAAIELATISRCY